MKENHIVYATDHNYAFVCAVSVASLLEHRNKEDKYYIHVLTDGSLDSDDMALFNKLEEIHSECVIEIRSVLDKQVDMADLSNYHLTKMTFYRLLIPDILSEVDKCIYLDADTLICDDIALLMNQDVSNCYLGAVIDRDIRKVGYDNLAGLNLDNYFNAGILLMNLKRMRDYGLMEQFFSLINKEWPYRDQDILNKVCEDNVLLLDDRFNKYSYCISEDDNPIIIHYIGDCGMRPWQYITARNGKSWWKVAEIFSEFDIYINLREAVQRKHLCGKIEFLVEQCNKYKGVYIFGSGYYGDRLVRSLQRNHVTNIENILDNNKSLWGKKIAGLIVVNPCNVEYAEEDLVIIAIKNKAARWEIVKQLGQLGVIEQQILFYEEKLPEEYFYMAPEYQKEERENVLLRELGTGTNRLGWNFNRLG